MSAPSGGDRAAIVASVHRTASYAVTPLTVEQLESAIALAVDLYATAASHGLSRPDADAVTCFVSAAVDGVRARRWTR